jgi:hypothetical protein
MSRSNATGAFLNEAITAVAGLTPPMIQESIRYTYQILDALDQTLVASEAPRMARMVELANLSSIVGNLLAAGVVKAGQGAFARNLPHKFPDLVAQQDLARDIEIKVALEGNRPKGHLAKSGYYLTYRYVLCDDQGNFTPRNTYRGDTVYIWEVRFGYLEAQHFSTSNTEGDSGKTAVINTAGMLTFKWYSATLKDVPIRQIARSLLLTKNY